jgi:hypothetical protein
MAKLYDWGDGKGKVHTKSKADHEKALSDSKAAANRVTDPPSGYYDPNLDVQQRDEQRAFDRNSDDLNLSGARAGVDLGFQTARTGIEKTRTGEDYDTGVAGIERGAGRSLSDLLQARTRGGEDYQSSLGGLQRSYDRLANTQGEAARKSGAELTGGVFAQSARKRAENQALDKAPIDLAYQRFTQDSNTSEGRLGEDKATSLADLLRSRTRADEDVNWNQGQAGLGYERTTTDIGTALERAGTDHSNFQQDIKGAKQFQWGGQAITGTGAPATTIKAPTPAVAPSPTSSPAPTSITAAPGAPGVKTTKRRSGKNRVVTYSNSVGGP